MFILNQIILAYIYLGIKLVLICRYANSWVSSEILLFNQKMFKTSKINEISEVSIF